MAMVATETLRAKDESLANPADARRQVSLLLAKRHEREKRSVRMAKEFEVVNAYLATADQVTAALEQLSQQLFRQLLSLVEEKLTIALQEILEQPIKFHADADFKRGAATVEFWIDRDGNREDVLRGQGGSVANILSVGLRLFALTTLDEARHRRFLVLDEQDCWLRPDLVPKLVKIVHEAGKALGFQVLMISHHDVSIFEQYADRVYQCVPAGNGRVEVRQVMPGRLQSR
jgi:ABC-type glutathione transport system ATPase component